MKAREMNRLLMSIRATAGDMTLQRLNAFLTIAEAGPDGISLGEVGRRAGIHQANTSKLVRSWAALTARKERGPGYITAEADPMDLSTKICKLTPKGREFLQLLFEE